MPEPRRPRVIILGGGMGALTAAFHLTADPSWKQRYDSIELYQPGWRLGGKCASSRNPARGWRNEEHGLHMWFGFYENAFAMMRACYAERQADEQQAQAAKAGRKVAARDAPGGCPGHAGQLTSTRRSRCGRRRW